METGTKIERDEERVAAATAMMVVELVMVERGKRMRMSGMPELTPQALRMRSQRQLNNI